MRKVDKDARNMLLAALILGMFGCLNLMAYFGQTVPTVYLDNKRLPIAIDRQQLVKVQDFCQQVALDYTLDGDQLVIEGESQQVIQLQTLSPKVETTGNAAATEVPLQALCEALHIPYQWDAQQQVIKLGETFANAAEVPVLMYHHILPEKDITGIFANNNIVVSQENFQQQLDYLREHGYQTVSLSMLAQYVSGERLLPEKSVVITFDDGYLSNYTYAYPMLNQAGFKGVIFLLTSFVEAESQVFSPKAVQYLSWPQVKDMRSTFEFASHTNNMHRLGKNGKGVLYEAPYSDIVSDLAISRQQLHHTPYFSYPYGHYSRLAMDTLRGQGMELAFTVNEGSVKAGDNPLALNRWDVARYQSLEKFAGIFE